jgi:hypothetical protein
MFINLSKLGMSLCCSHERDVYVVKELRDYLSKTL